MTRGALALTIVLASAGCSRADRRSSSEKPLDAGSSLVFADREKLERECLELAEKLLREQGGEFYPFAAAIDSNGEVTLLGAKPESEPPRSFEVVTVLEGMLREGARAGKYRATAVVAIIRVTDVSDAVSIRFEHRERDSTEVLVPFDVDAGQVTLGPRRTRPRTAYVFAH